ncbi:hypothetical protein F5B20DRAFT_35796 [Whalleya microplaca]|nr:hypothetical protein F5B20DRAFT_35796 [Whalleya microplaca]
MYNQPKIVRRLLGRHGADPASDGNLGVTSSPTPQAYRPNASQNAVYPSSMPIACIDRSPDGQVAVLGGRHILKTVYFDGLNIKEGVDVRAVITAQFANKTSLTSEQLSIKDTKLSSTHGNDLTIFTACANGKIFLYDVNRLGSGAGLEFIQSREESRQINKLDFNPHRGSLLLSGSQDGVVRCFDVKVPATGRGGATFRTFQAFRCNADGISDVKWSPKDGVIFACATDSGVVLKWDFRKSTAPLLKINAHDTQKGASAISWHPDGDHLISSGLDSKCYVWDLSENAEKRQKPKWTINAPAPVTSVAWRPGLWSATAQGRRAAQVAVSYDEGGHIKKGISSIHIWDLARPTMPYKEIDVFENSPNALLWHDQDLLWTAGQDGFAQCDVAFAPKVVDRQPLSSLAFSARGDALMFLEERIQLPRPRPTVSAHQALPTSSYSSSPTGQMLSISRSDSEEDVIGSFLGPKRRARDKRRASTRSVNMLSTTPPSGAGVEDQVISLDQAIKLTGAFRPQQVMAIGRVPAAPKIHLYHHLSRQYLEILERDLPCAEGAKPLNDRICEIIEQYARAAESASQFRLAQTWRVLAYATKLLLSRRSQYHLEQRLARREITNMYINKEVEAKSTFLKPGMSPQVKANGDETPRKSPSVASVESRRTPGRSLLSDEIDSESNVPTPLAQPVNDDTTHRDENVGGKRLLTPVQEMESFNLPPAIHSEAYSTRKRHDSAPVSISSQMSQKSSTEGYDFYDLGAVDVVPKVIDIPKKKEPLTFDYTDTITPNSRRKPVARHDSDESFAQMFSLSDASRQTTTLTSSSGESTRQTVGSQQNGTSSEEIETEYGSRIRGKEMRESPEKKKYPARSLAKWQDSDSPTEDFFISQTITDTLDNLDSGPSQYEHNRFRVQPSATGPPNFNKLSQEHATERPENHPSPHITGTDFLPWADDPPYPHPIASETAMKNVAPPINPYDLICRAINFEAGRSALNASAMILLLKPLVPDDVIDSYQAAAILRQYHSRLMGMKLFVEAALLRNLCVRGWPSGIDIWGENYIAIFAPAQDRVVAAFTCSQCHKPREIDHAITDGPGIWKCERCRAVMAPCAVCGHRDATDDPLSLVPVSEALTAAPPLPDEPVLSTWWYCPGCAHGGHANCLLYWHAPVTPPAQQPPNISSTSADPSALPETPFPETNSDGCCPFDGCGHACLPGKYRNESAAARTEELGRAVREQTREAAAAAAAAGFRKAAGGGGKERKASSASASAAYTMPGLVRGDTVEVPQSRAVESVREALSSAGIGGSGGSNGGSYGIGSGGGEGRPSGLLSILSSSPGRATSSGGGGGTAGGEGTRVPERERRKSVKFAGAAADRR